MISRLKGYLVARDGHRATLDVHDVGYDVHAPLRDIELWASMEAAVIVHVITDVREDAITLYGFAADADRRAFERLRQVNGVGPKVALSTLDALGLDGLAQAIAADDIRALSTVPGVGKKLAQRLALELKDKLGAGFSPEVATAGASGPAAPRDDQLDLALARLGYARSEIVQARTRLTEAGIDAEAPVADRLREALRLLSGR